MRRHHPSLSRVAQAEMLEAYAVCRATSRHALEVIPSSPTMRPSFGSLLTRRCLICGTLRYDIVSRVSGQILSTRYDHPDGYRDEAKHDRSWWRATWYDQLGAAAFLDAEQRPAKVTPITKGRKRPATKGTTR